MSKSSKRLLSFFVVIMLMFALCMTMVLLQSRQSIAKYKDDKKNTQIVANINPNSWDGSNGLSSDVRFQLGSSEDHVTMKYPTAIYLNKDESLGTAGYYFKIVSGHFGGSDANRVYINPHIWGYRHDSTNSPMDNIFNDYYYIARNEVDGSEVNVKSPTGFNDDMGFGIGSDYGRLLLNVYKYSNSDAGYNVKIKLQGTPKTTGTSTFTFSSVAGMHYTSSMISTQQWIQDNWWSDGWWRDLVHHNNMSPSPISIKITVYDKSALKTAIEELQTKSGYNQSVLTTANNVLTTREVTQSQIDTQVTNVRNEIDRVAKVPLTEKYNNLSNKLTNLGVDSTTAGYKAIFDDLTVANDIINSSTIDNAAINASVNALDYYLNIWDNYLAGGTNRIIKGTFGDYFATFIYPSKISMEMGQSLADLNYTFIVDANYNATNSDYRMFFDASGWGNKSDTINEYFNNYTYTASHSVGGGGGAGNWDFLNNENQTSVDNNWRFASVTYNSHTYLLVSAGHQSYKSIINISGSPKKAGQFSYNYSIQTIAQQWTSSWSTQYTISYSEPVSIDFEILNAGVAEAKENLENEKSNFIERVKKAPGKITNLEDITAKLAEIDNMLENDDIDLTADEINALISEVTGFNVTVDRNWTESDTYCLEKDIFVNTYDIYDYVTINGSQLKGDSEGKIKLTQSTYGSQVTVTYPDGSSFVLKLNADHTGYKCEESSTCTICGITLAERVHDWVKGNKLNDATCVKGEEFEYTCSYDQNHKKTDYEGTINPNNHDFGNWTSNNDATCEVDGTETGSCQRDGCSETDTRTIVDSKLGHSFGDWVSDDNATCEVDGTETRSCQRDGCIETETQVEVDSKLGHNWEKGDKINDATCVHGEEYRYTCTNDITHTKTEFEGAIDPNNHDFGNWISNNDATCEVDGTETGSCQRDGCNVTKNRTVEGTKLGHSFGDWVSDDNATCEVDGTETRSCQRDGCIETETQVEVDSKLGHNWEKGDKINDATCVHGEEYRYTCTNDITHTKTEFEGAIDPNNHDFGNWISNNDATCEVDGTETGSCQRDGCNVTKNRTVEGTKLGHNFGEWVSDGNATCEVDGTETKSCQRDGCNKTENQIDLNSKLGHDFGNWTSNNDATCEVDGTETGSCQRDGCSETETRTEVDSKLGHDISNWIGNNDATCETDGTETGTCQRDGCSETETRTEVDSKLGHNFGNYTSNNDATCEVDGTETGSCQRDGCSETETRTEVDSKLGHDISNWIGNNDATCETDGTETGTCQREGCNKTETRTEENSKLGHNFGNYTSNNDATCETDGTETGSCLRENCNATDTRVVEGSKVEHNWIKGDKINDATCIHGEEYNYTCSYNSNHTKTDYEGAVDPNNHSFGEWVSDGNATCEADGTESKICLNGCGEKLTQTEVDSALGHDYKFVEIISAATCTTQATNKYVCMHNESHVIEKIEGELDPNNHNWEVIDEKSATCTERGYLHKKCKDCNTETTVDIEPHGHDWDEGEITKQPTATEKGEKTYTCKLCGATKTEEIPPLGVIDEPTQPEDTNNSATSNIGAIVGGAVGGASGLIILIVVILIVIKKMKKN